MSAITYVVALMLLSQVTANPSRYATQDGNPVLDAKVQVKDEANIPSMEAGILTELAVREGTRVKEGDLLAQIDDREAKAAVKVAKYAEFAAIKRAEQDIEIRYAKAASNVSSVEVEQNLEANRQSKGAVSEIEVERSKLDYIRANLQIEKAATDRILASYDAKTRTAEREAAEMALEWRTIVAPFNGEVVKTFVHQSEWLDPGKPILSLVRFDELYVEGRLRAADFDREEIVGKPVTVEIEKARGRKVTVSGQVVHVDQTLVGNGTYEVRAEVKNELINNSWLLQPGSVARMTIHLDEVSQQTRAPNPEAENDRR